MKPRRSFPWHVILVILFFVVSGVVCGFLGAEKLGPHIDMKDTNLMVLRLGMLLLGMVVAISLHTVIHELGHLLFGFATGYRFCSFRVGKLMLVKVGGHLRLKRLSLTGTGGQCLMIPPDMEAGKLPVVLYNLGGSLLNFIIAVICLLVFLYGPWITALSECLIMSAVIGFSFALSNGIPMRMGVVDNDGYNAISLRRHPQAMRAWWIQLRANADICQGVRIKDMPDAWFCIPDAEGMQNSITSTLGVFACSRLMDEHRFAEADALIEKILQMDAGIVGLHRNFLISDWIYCELIGQCREEKLLARRDKAQMRFERAMSRHPSVLRTQYCWALLYEKNVPLSRKYRKAFSDSAKSYPYPCEMEAERELMQIARERAGELHNKI